METKSTGTNSTGKTYSYRITRVLCENASPGAKAISLRNDETRGKNVSFKEYDKERDFIPVNHDEIISDTDKVFTDVINSLMLYASGGWTERKITYSYKSGKKKKVGETLKNLPPDIPAARALMNMVDYIRNKSVRDVTPDEEEARQQDADTPEEEVITVEPAFFEKKTDEQI